MDYAELLFALQMRQRVIKELEEKLPDEMSSYRRQICISNNFDGYLAAALEEVEDTAGRIRNIRRR